MMDVDMQALIDELAKLEIAPDVARFAFFDADHTLWSGDMGDLAFAQALDERRFLPEAAAPLAALFDSSGGTPQNEPHADARALYERYKADAVSEEAIVEAMVVCFAGWRREALVELGSEIMRDSLSAKVYEGLPAVLDVIRNAGIEVRVISGTAQELIEGGVTALGIEPSAVRGATAAIVHGKIADYLDGPPTYRDGKVAAMRAMIGERTAVVGFGDSTSDAPMLGCCALRVGVNPRPALRAHAQSHEPERWRFVVPDRTVDGIAVQPMTTNRVIV